MTVAFLAIGGGAFGWGRVRDHHGPRIAGIAAFPPLLRL
jgi:hypothetical protein